MAVGTHADAAAPQAMKRAIDGGDAPKGQALVEYYRRRLAAFESEREEMLLRLDAACVSFQESHRSEWELKKKEEEVKELQKALSDAHTYVFDERERYLKLQAENDELKLQEVEDRKRIQHLLSLHGPVEQEITYFRNEKPEGVVTYPPARHPANKESAAAGGGPANASNVTRTVYLPSSNADSLMLKIESLQAQLNEQTQFAAERVAALLEDRRIREQDDEAHKARMDARFEEMQLKLQRTEELLQNTTKDYIVLRRAANLAEQRACEAEAQAEAATAEAERKVNETVEACERDKAAAKAAAEARAEEYVSKFRNQVKQREEEIVTLESMHAAVRSQLERRIVELEGKLKRATQARKAIEYRRALDLEGFSRDVSNIRRQLTAIDRRFHAMRLQERLDDDERLDALLEQIEARAPGGGGGALVVRGGARTTAKSGSRARAARGGRMTARSTGAPARRAAPGGVEALAGTAEALEEVRAQLGAMERRLYDTRGTELRDADVPEGGDDEGLDDL